MARNYFKHFEALVANFKKPEEKQTKTRKRYTGGKRWRQEERLIVVGMVQLGATNKQIAEVLCNHGNRRTEVAVQVEKSRLFKDKKPGKKYHFTIEL
jgi:acetylglutamate kinase